jgi:purine-binding chemotaxis protein CheW
VFDLRSKLGVKAQTRGERTCVFVFAINTADAQYLAGAAVDAIAEVVNINGGDIEPPPQDTWIEEDFLIGLGKLKGKVLMILALAPLLNEEEIVFIKKEFGEKRESLVFGLEKALETS